MALGFAIPDHHWVDSANGAAVRIAMTVGVPATLEAGRLLAVTSEQTGEFGEVAVTLAESVGLIHADLSVGANVASAVALQANENMSNRGVQLFGGSFMVTPEDAAALGLGSVQGLERHIRAYRNGRDLTDAPRGVRVIDLFGLSAAQARNQYPAVYQWLLERVKPERDQNNRASRRDNWWLLGETNPKLRKQLAGLPRYIATVETAKHRTFQFLDASILPDNMLIAIASIDAFHLGVLSSRVHRAWALVQGGTLEDRPRYNKTRCFETFPFPADGTGLTPELRERIAQLAEQIDAHRKRQQAAHTGLTLTGMYNALEALREGRALTAKEKTLHEQGLVSVLKELHDELDAAVLQAYGPAPQQSTDALLSQLVALNTRRAAEEKTGLIRWLRPAFQDPAFARAAANTLSTQEQTVPTMNGLQADLTLDLPQQPVPPAKPVPQQPWPSALPEQVRALAQLLASAPSVLPLPAIEAHFKGRGPWKNGLPRILDTLEALGRARREGAGDKRRRASNAR